ncbi:MAG: redoxin domain-containing protein [Opitutales bacterium]
MGAKTPSVLLANQKGEATELDSVIGGKPSVVIFYRGDWCPFCNA